MKPTVNVQCGDRIKKFFLLPFVVIWIIREGNLFIFFCFFWVRVYVYLWQIHLDHFFPCAKGRLRRFLAEVFSRNPPHRSSRLARCNIYTSRLAWFQFRASNEL